MKIKAKIFDKELGFPKYMPAGAAGFDFTCRTATTIKPGETKTVPLNIAMKVPEGYVVIIAPRSSTHGRLGLVMPHSVGILDPYYSGDNNEIVALFYNSGKKIAKIHRGDTLAQGLLIKCERAEFVEVASLGKGSEPGWQMPKRRA
jgi:dUTP pyrophosphatase